MIERYFTRKAKRHFLRESRGIGRIITHALHRMSWSGRVQEGRHRKAVLAMASKSGTGIKAIEKAYVDRMVEMDQHKKETGEYGSFDSPKVYSDALNYEQAFATSDFAEQEKTLPGPRQSAIDEFF